MRKTGKQRSPGPVPPRAARRPEKANAAGIASGRHEALVTVVNKRGLHARAAAKFVKLASQFEADIKVTATGGLAGATIVSGRSIMGLMMLAAAPGSILHISAEGPDGASALAALIGLVDAGFEEED